MLILVQIEWNYRVKYIVNIRYVLCRVTMLKVAEIRKEKKIDWKKNV